MEEDKLNALFAGVEYDIQLLNRSDDLVKLARKEARSSMIDKFEALVAKQPKKPFVIYDDLVYTYEAIDNLACRVANIAKTWNLRPQDSVAILIQNEPSYIYTFLGLQKLGIPVALINTNLTAQPLVHSLKSAESKILIVGSGEELLAAVTDILPELGNIPVYAQGVRQKTLPAGIQSIDDLMRDIYPGTPSPAARSGVTQMDICCFIYTSGTTGNPKPVIIPHWKASLFCTTHSAQLGMNHDEVTYIAIPLYHTAGFLTAFGGSLVQGSTLVLRKKFSAQNFWSDCRRHKVTTVPYVGEVMRYLVSQPKSELDGVHNVRGILGNGLRADVFKEMQERFKIPKIVELFGSTEATNGIFNIFGKPGAVGRLSPLLRRLDREKKSLIKFDFETAQPIRNEKGRCTLVQPGEPGLMIMKLHGFLRGKKLYQADSEATEKKLLYDVFEEGDCYFNFGDALVQDKEYFLYFYDRLGDTFRWKSENVSTQEVANAITSLEFVEETNVYGVKIPGHEGKAGMAAITLNPNVQLGNKELQELYRHVSKQLPLFARPLFVRHMPEAILTGTFKNKKVDLAKEGYDLNKVNDPLYFIDNENKTYSPLTKSKLSKFMSSKL